MAGGGPRVSGAGLVGLLGIVLAFIATMSFPFLGIPWFLISSVAIAGVADRAPPADGAPRVRPGGRPAPRGVDEQGGRAPRGAPGGDAGEGGRGGRLNRPRPRLRDPPRGVLPGALGPEGPPRDRGGEVGGG